MKMFKLTMSMLLALGLLGTTPAFAQDDEDDETMNAVEEGSNAEGAIELPEDADQEGVDNSEFGRATATEAREKGREFGQERASEARERGQEARDGAAGSARESAADAAESAREGAGGRPDNLPGR